MTHGSLFAGIGGFDLGFERAGFNTKWQVEIDDYCLKVLEKNFPNAQRFKDIRECGKANLEPVDIISGGFPCVDISYAGKGAGIEGAISGLWKEMCRVICELRPRYAVVENVAALLGRGMGRVLGDLATCGYDCEWDCLPAAAFGAPHRRDRVFIVAHTPSPRHSEGRLQEGRSIRNKARRARPDGLGADVADAKGARERPISAGQRPEGERTTYPDRGSEGLAHAESQRLQGLRSNWVEVLRPHEGARIFGRGDSRGQGAEWWAIEPDMGRVAHGVPSRVDRLKGLGNAVVPQVAEWIATRIREYEEGQ